MGAPAPVRDQTLADYTQNGELDLYVDSTGTLTGMIDPWPLGILERADFCPRLHVAVTVNGVAVALQETGSGTQVSGPLPVYRCAVPSFATKIDASPGSAIDVRISDETLTWSMSADFPNPTGTIPDPAGLRVGTWESILLDPAPASIVLDFEGTDAGMESFSVRAAYSADAGCPVYQVVVDSPDGGMVTTDAGVPCPLQFTDAGIMLYVPQGVPPGPGDLGMLGWPPYEVTECVGTSFCHMAAAVNPVGPVLNIATQISL